MQLTSKTFAALRNLSMAIVVSLAVCPAALAQITVTNATFPVAGDILKSAVAANPAIGIAVWSPPGGGQFWNLSGLQPGALKNTSFKPAGQGAVGAQVPGAELFTVNSPGTEDYYNVTSNRFELQAYYGIAPYDLVANNLFDYAPPLPERQAPLNFFDIYSSSSGIIEPFLPSAFTPSLMGALPFTVDSLRYRVSINRIEVVDAYGTLSIPGGTYNVLRKKRTEYRGTRLDGKIPALGWLDITDNVITAGFHGLGVDTTVTFFFYNDVVKEPIAAVTFNNQQNATTQVIYKYNAPALPVRLILFEGKSTEKGNELEWKTSSEQNFSHYELERSKDAKTFVQIAKVNGARNAKENLAYNFTDKDFYGAGMVADPYTNSTPNREAYYRLKMMDLDGSYEYSPIVFVKNIFDSAIQAYPNPASDYILVSNQLNKQLNIKLLDAIGREILEQETSSELVIKIPVTEIESGAYFLQIQNGVQIIYKKIMVNR